MDTKQDKKSGREAVLLTETSVFVCVLLDEKNLNTTSVDAICLCHSCFVVQLSFFMCNMRTCVSVHLSMRFMTQRTTVAPPVLSSGSTRGERSTTGTFAAAEACFSRQRSVACL